MKTSVLEFKLLEDLFCFNTKDVEYVFDLEEYETLKGFHKSVIGITKYNNDVMLLIDTAQLYSSKVLDLNEQKSVIVIKDDNNMHYGMLVDEITKLEETQSVKLSVDLNTEDMVINHYKDEEADEIVSEIHPLPLFKKYDIPAMSSSTFEENKSEKSVKNGEDNYLLFKVNKHSYAIASKFVKEVLERDKELFLLEDSNSHIKAAMAVRDEVISIVQLEESNTSNDILVLEISGKKLGLEVNEVYDIENFQLQKLEYIGNEASKISAFYNHNGEVVAIINPNFFISENKDLLETSKDKLAQERQLNKLDYLIFWLDDKKFSIAMSCVRQVIETDSLSKTSSSSIVGSDNVEFITTWDNRAVNIIRLDLELDFECHKDASQSIFIEYNGHTVAFMVQDIDNIVYLNKEDITESSSKENTLINGAVMYKNEVIVKMNEAYISSLG